MPRRRTPRAAAAPRGRRARTKAATVVAQSLVGEIHRRGLRVGDKLLSEQKMVERYGVARGSLREALRYLELQGVLRIKSGPGGGPVIQTPDGRHFASTLGLMLQFVGARFRAIVETRWVVEPGIAALAAERASADDLAALRECLAALRGTAADGARFAEENRRFHDLLAFASGNPVFRFLLPALHRLSDGAGIAYSAGERKRVVRALAVILAAIEARDRTAAYEATRAFFDASLAYLDEAHADEMARPLTWTR
ncbi:MAG: FCD domain-containing protein [Deltaproteobacteria bacterium]|nr:FCD domain-containing protein [Deltaproteobacteria bacterium]